MAGLDRITGVAALGARTAAAFGRIAADRVAETFGAALPRTPAQLARADRVDTLLRDHAPHGSDALPPVREVRLPGVAFESSNCSNFLIEVAFDAGSSAHADRALPESLYAKLPCTPLTTRAFANAVGFWEVEATFCERIAARVPVRVPRVYAVARRGARFVLLLEDLHALPGIRLFTNRDMAAGTTPRRARRCLETLAEFHAAFWGWDRERREALLPVALHPYLGPGARARSRALNAAAIAPARRAAPELFRREHAALCRLAIAKWDALVDAWYGASTPTLIHGDSHLANAFEYDTPEGPRVGLLDFQGAQWGPAMRDVQYLLIDSLEPDVLAAHEDTLVDAYLRALAQRGVALAPGAARDAYRALAFQTLMVAVVSIGLGSLTEREATLRTVLRRSLAAIERLGFEDWLERL